MKTNRKGHVGWILLGICYLGLCLLSVLGAIAPWLGVAYSPFIQITPVFLFYLLFVHLFVSLYYLKRLRGLAILGVIMLLICLPGGLKDLRINKDVQAQAEPAHISVASFNVRNFRFSEEYVDSVTFLLQNLEADVICLQEFRNHELPEGERAQQYLARKLNMPYHRFVTLPVHIHGAAIFSRYPIIAVDTLFVSDREINSGILATLQGPKGKLGIGNVHLPSFHVAEVWKKNPDWKQRFDMLKEKAEAVVVLQEEKSNTVISKLERYPYPFVLTGDMNAVPHSRTLAKFSKRYQDSFLAKGQGIGWTYPLRGPFGIRIDYQFASPGVEVLTHEIVESYISDHYPIVASYKILGQ